MALAARLAHGRARHEEEVGPRHHQRDELNDDELAKRECVYRGGLQGSAPRSRWTDESVCVLVALRFADQVRCCRTRPDCGGAWMTTSIDVITGTPNVTICSSCTERSSPDQKCVEAEHDENREVLIEVLHGDRAPRAHEDVPRCCRSAFIGTTKSPAQMPTRTMTIPAMIAAQESSPRTSRSRPRGATSREK